MLPRCYDDRDLYKETKAETLPRDSPARRSSARVPCRPLVDGRARTGRHGISSVFIFITDGEASWFRTASEVSTRALVTASRGRSETGSDACKNI